MSRTAAVSTKGLPTPERMFRLVLWVVAVIFAGFLIGLDSLVVRDLPTVRLAITLAPLAIASWLFVRKRRTQAWPFAWGFIFFAAFTFFAELVPYLPSFGGYVRDLIGILVTVVVGRYAIVAMQRHLERQRLAEQQSEAVRRQSLSSYEHAIKSVNAGMCPGCERGFKGHEGRTNFCVHCGMKLFESCPVCTHRKNAFFHYCPACGADKPAADSAPPGSMTVAPVA